MNLSHIFLNSINNQLNCIAFIGPGILFENLCKVLNKTDNPLYFALD